MRLSTLALSLLIAGNLAGCKRDQPAEQPPVEAAAADTTPAAGATPAASAAPTEPAAAPAASVPAGKSFDIESVPVTNKALPPFPYVGTPAEVAEVVHTSKDLEFDRVHVIAGDEFRPVEGKVFAAQLLHG